jgi:hypothetical protein
MKSFIITWLIMIVMAAPLIGRWLKSSDCEATGT